jgi:hypothetical protein
MPFAQVSPTGKTEVSKKEDRSTGAKMTENNGKALKIVNAADFEVVQLGHQRRGTA